MLGIPDENYFMKQAYNEAQKAALKGEVPVGAVVVAGHQIIARAHNQTEQLNDVTAHAEILAITAASSYLGGKYLIDCKLYVTLEPCPMCAGALQWAQLGELIYAVEDEKRGFMRYGITMLHSKTQLRFGLMNDQCKGLLSNFFANLRE